MKAFLKKIQNRYFREPDPRIKDFPLYISYPRTGAHWTMSGSLLIQKLDEFIRFVKKNRGDLSVNVENDIIRIHKK